MSTSNPKYFTLAARHFISLRFLSSILVSIPLIITFSVSGGIGGGWRLCRRAVDFHMTPFFVLEYPHLN